MSLRVDDDRRGRSRSRSESRYEDIARDRSTGPNMAPVVVDAQPPYRYSDYDVSNASYRRGGNSLVGGLPYPEDGTGMMPVPQQSPSAFNYIEKPGHNRRASFQMQSSPGNSNLSLFYSSQDKPEDSHAAGPVPGSVPKSIAKGLGLDQFIPQKYSGLLSGRTDEEKARDKKNRQERYEDDLAYGKAYSPAPADDKNPTYGDVPNYSYGHRKPDDPARLSLSQLQIRPSSPNPSAFQQPARNPFYPDDPRYSSPSVLTVEAPRHARSRSRKRSTSRHRSKSRHRSRSRQRSHERRRMSSPKPPTNRLSAMSLGVPMAAGAAMAGGLGPAPPSPLLESYRGTWQEMSPMPSPMLLPSQTADSLQLMEPLSPVMSDDDERRRPRRARFHDPEDITLRIATALKGSGRPQTEPLIEILPGLTHEQVMELRAAYKAIVKTGTEHKGVNVAKHIRARLKDESSSLMKACYSTALGKWESEAYWASFWYQGDKTRRELLIEALMGRSNAEIRAIKAAFTEKKYDRSLIKCMKTELKEDKFKKAVLLALEGQRTEELDVYGRRIPIDMRLVDQDVDDLRRAVKSEKGGESLMISIVVQRSEAHLREVLREYDHIYRSSFARDALKKSTNLVVCFLSLFLSTASLFCSRLTLF